MHTFQCLFLLLVLQQGCSIAIVLFHCALKSILQYTKLKCFVSSTAGTVELEDHSLFAIENVLLRQTIIFWYLNILIPMPLGHLINSIK